MLQTSKIAPGFQLKGLDGVSVSLDELLARGPVLLAFFKVNCPVCQLSGPFLSRLAAGALRTIGISQDDAKATRAFVKDYGVTFPVLLDEGRAGYPVSNAFQISTVPSIFLVEPDGVVSAAFSSFSKQDFEAIGIRAGAPPFLPGEKVPAFRAG